MSVATDKAPYGAPKNARLFGDAYFSIDPCIGDTIVGALTAVGVTPRGMQVWEPAAGRGDLMGDLERHGMNVIGSDLYDHDGRDPRIHVGCDLLQIHGPLGAHIKAVITNPPFDQLDAVAEHLVRIAPGAWVGLLVRSEWIHAARRRRLLSGGRLHAIAILPRRPNWFPKRGQKEGDQSPRFAFSWLLFRPDGLSTAEPIVLFAPKPPPVQVGP